MREAEPVIASYARACRLMGGAGAGQLTKMVNQICIAGLVQGLAEGLHFAARAGLDRQLVIDVISKGAAQSWQMDNRHKTMIAGKFDFGFAVDWMRKDLAICLDEARRNGARLPVAALVDQFYSDVQAMGGGALGHFEPDRAAGKVREGRSPPFFVFRLTADRAAGPACRRRASPAVSPAAAARGVGCGDAGAGTGVALSDGFEASAGVGVGSLPASASESAIEGFAADRLRLRRGGRLGVGAAFKGVAPASESGSASASRPSTASGSASALGVRFETFKASSVGVGLTALALGAAAGAAAA